MGDWGSDWIKRSARRDKRTHTAKSSKASTNVNQHALACASTCSTQKYKCLTSMHPKQRQRAHWFSAPVTAQTQLDIPHAHRVEQLELLLLLVVRSLQKKAKKKFGCMIHQLYGNETERHIIKLTNCMRYIISTLNSPSNIHSLVGCFTEPSTWNSLVCDENCSRLAKTTEWTVIY